MTSRGVRWFGRSWLVLAALLCVSCAQGGGPAATSTPSPESAAIDTLADTRWQASDIGGAAPVADTIVTAAFSADGVLTGSAGCNRYRTNYKTDGTSIRIAETGATTMMACPEPVMAQERVFLSSLAAARSFELTPDTLTLNNEMGTALVTFTVQDQELEGSWHVTAYNNGQTAVVGVVDGTTPSFEFADGMISGTAGCNRLTGTYSVDGTSLTIGPLAGTRMACPEPDGVMEQETALVAALEGAATFTIEGDTLEFRRADDEIAVQLRRG